MIVLLSWTLRMSVVLLLAFAVLFLLRRRSAALRHWVLTLSLLCAGLTPALTFIVPSLTVSESVYLPVLMRFQPFAVYWGYRQETAILEEHRRQLDLRREFQLLREPFDLPTAVSTDNSPRISPDIQSTAPPTVIVKKGAYRFPEPRPIKPPTHSPSAESILLWVWFAGALVGCATLVAGAIRLSRVGANAEEVSDDSWLHTFNEILKDYGLRRQVRLLRTDRPSLLATCGALKPRVFLPAGAAEWGTDRIHVVLAHELAHVRRQDWQIQMLAEILRAIFWFNPLFWIASSQLRFESERACDDAVLRRGVRPSEYAAHLMDLARSLKGPRRTWAPALMMSHRVTLEGRFKAILNPRVDHSAARRRSIFVAADLFVVITILLAGVRVVEAIRPPRPAPAQSARQAAATQSAAQAERVAPAAPAERGGPIRQQIFPGPAPAAIPCVTRPEPNDWGLPHQSDTLEMLVDRANVIIAAEAQKVTSGPGPRAERVVELVATHVFKGDPALKRLDLFLRNSPRSFDMDSGQRFILFLGNESAGGQPGVPFFDFNRGRSDAPSSQFGAAFCIEGDHVIGDQGTFPISQKYGVDTFPPSNIPIWFSGPSTMAVTRRHNPEGLDKLVADMRHLIEAPRIKGQVVVEGGAKAEALAGGLYAVARTSENPSLGNRLHLTLTPVDGSPVAVRPVTAIDYPLSWWEQTAKWPDKTARLTEIDRDGVFKLRLEAGLWNVRLDGLLPVGYFLKSLSSGSTNLLAEPLRVTASGAPDIQLTLTDQPPGGSPVRRVSGRVTGVPSDLLPASLGLVILTAQDTEDAGAARSSQTSVGANGVFEFARVPRGRYRLEVIGGLARQVTLGLDNTAASITVDSADVEIELPLLRGGVEVRGNVAVRDGAAWAALRGISFEVAGAPESAPNRRLAVTHVAPNGGFRVWLAPGAYTVKTDQCCQPENVVVDSVVSGSVDLRQAPLKVGTAPVDPIIVTVKPDPSRRR